MFGRTKTGEGIRCGAREWTLGKAFREAFTTPDGRKPKGSPERGGKEDAGPILGIDLGTTHAVVAVVQGARIVVVPNQEGETLTPAVVARTENGEWLIGEPARRQAVLNPGRTIRSIKRRMGRLEKDKAPRVLLGDVDCPPQQITALLLNKLRAAAEAWLGQSVRRAVLTVPSCFDEAQRQATIEAAHIAGLDTEWQLRDPRTGRSWRTRMRLINEPTAAALAFGLCGAWERSVRILVLHLGGGSLDISVLNIGDSVFQVEAVGGNTALGGDDFDDVLVKHFAKEFLLEHSLDPRRDPAARERLREAVEQLRRDLSVGSHAEAHLPWLVPAPGGARGLDATLSRDQLERLTAPLIERCRDSIRQTLAAARLEPAAIDEVVLVGGMTRMPRIQRLVEEELGRDAARRVHSDEAVAVGAAIHGAQLQLGGTSQLLLVDAVAQPLGVETADGKVQYLVNRNDAIPRERRATVAVRKRDIDKGSLRVVQQEEASAGVVGHRLLGEVALAGLRASGKESVDVEVTFNLDANAILDVTVRDVASGRSWQARLFPSGGLAAAEVERLRREAEQERLIRRQFGT